LFEFSAITNSRSEAMSELGDDTRMRLLDAAGEVFAEKGLQAATVREICRRAGANVASVNYYFGGKDQLYIEAVRHAHCAPDAYPTETWPPDAPAADKLRSFIAQMLAGVLDRNRPSWHAQLMLREMTHPTDACRELVEATLRPRMQMLQEIVDELMPSVTAEPDRHLTAFSIVGQCVFFNRGNPIAALLVGEEEYETYDVDRLADHISRFSLAAVGHGSSVHGPAFSELKRP
jgi:AcrR family transcriptional regulator